MKRFTTHCALPAVAVALWLLAGNNHLQAQAPETTPSVTGEWHGIVQVGDVVVPIWAAITTQDFRRFEGTQMVGDFVYDIAGTVAADDSVHIVGKGDAGILIGLLRYSEQEDGTATLDGSLMLNLPNGERVVGDFQVVRSPKQPGE